MMIDTSAGVVTLLTKSSAFTINCLKRGITFPSISPCTKVDKARGRVIISTEIIWTNTKLCSPKNVQEKAEKGAKATEDDMANLHSKWFLRECGLRGGKRRKTQQKSFSSILAHMLREIYFRRNLHFIHLNLPNGALNTQFSYMAAIVENDECFETLRQASSKAIFTFSALMCLYINSKPFFCLPSRLPLLFGCVWRGNWVYLARAAYRFWTKSMRRLCVVGIFGMK